VLTTPLEFPGDGVVLIREIAPGDSEVLYNLRMDPRCRPMFRTVDLVPYERHMAMIEEYFRSRDCWFTIEVASNVVGAIALYNFEDRQCECGRIVIAPESQGLGYGSRALRLVMKYAKTLGLRKLHCEILSTNTASVRLFEHNGFVPTCTCEYAGRILVKMMVDLDAA
jgi:RimJ/RimL family protein N-acetyltransferase